MKQLKKLAFALAAVAAAACAWADPSVPGGDPIDEDPDWYEDTIEGYTWQYVIESGDYNGAMIVGIEPSPTGPVAIPDSVSLPQTGDSLTVVGVGNEAFRGCSGITSVTIPETFQRIGASAFLDCTSLATVDLGNATPDINFSAFSGCNSLKTFTVSSYNPVYKVVSKMLVTKQTDVLTCGVNGAVTIPSGVKTIGPGAFWGLGGLTSVKIPSGVTAIDMNAFRDCSSLTSVTIPDSVTSIGDCAFAGCDGLSSVTIPDSVTSIGQSAFKGCKSSLFDTKTIPGVKLVDGWAVGYTSSLSGALDLTGVRGIAEGAFADCTAITSVKLPNGLTAIPDYVFEFCDNLTTVTIPKSVLDISKDAFPRNVIRTVWTEKGDTERVKSLLEDAWIDTDKITFKEIGTSFKLTVKSSNTSYGTVSGSGTYDEGTKVTIQAQGLRQPEAGRQGRDAVQEHGDLREVHHEGRRQGRAQGHVRHQGTRDDALYVDGGLQSLAAARREIRHASFVFVEDRAGGPDAGDADGQDIRHSHRARLLHDVGDGEDGGRQQHDA